MPLAGNVRELRNVIERAMIICQGPTLFIDVPPVSDLKTSSKLTLGEVERNHIVRVLEGTGWRVRGKNGAAELLGLKPTTLDSRIKKLRIQRRYRS